MLQKPDLLVVDKKRTCKIIDSAVPRDSRIDEKEKEKTEKVSRSKKGVTEDLECESEDYTISCWLFRCYNTWTVWYRLKETGITAEIGQVQRTVLLGTARIFRKVLEI